MSSASDRRYGVVVPVKPAAVAKTRLLSLGDDVRADLVAAFAADTVAAALDCAEVAAVLVVTDDHVLAGALSELGAAVVPDGVAGDLNESLRQGAAELLRLRPGLRPVALCADLPCLRPGELSVALGVAEDRPARFVPDSAGQGTTLYAAADLDTFAPRFGHASRTAHVSAGVFEVDVRGIETVSRDVDVPDDLVDALRLGVGPRTAWAVTRHNL